MSVPGIRLVDAATGVLGIEWVDGRSVRFLLGSGEEGDEEEATGGDPLAEYGVSQGMVCSVCGARILVLRNRADDVMRRVGTEIAKLHLADVVHGDLTTSNMMLRRPTAVARSQLVLIDFGLAYISTLVEDKAVDLYVLERAFASTHPDSEPLFASVLRAYEKKMGKEWPPVGRRLDEVRLRGRKRSMVG